MIILFKDFFAKPINFWQERYNENPKVFIIFVMLCALLIALSFLYDWLEKKEIVPNLDVEAERIDKENEENENANNS